MITDRNHKSELEVNQFNENINHKFNNVDKKINGLE